jgi:hypothetical protein
VWRSRGQLELAIVEWIGWFNEVRLHSALGDRPPGEFERTALSAPTESQGSPASPARTHRPEHWKPPNPASAKPGAAHFLTLTFDGAWPESPSPAIWAHFRVDGPSPRVTVPPRAADQAGVLFMRRAGRGGGAVPRRGQRVTGSPRGRPRGWSEPSA